MNRHDNRLCSSDDLARLLQTFAQRYIRKTFISRFMHEAKKKPEQLHARVCHSPEQLFHGGLRGSPQCLPATGEFLTLENTGFKVGTWEHCEADLLICFGGLVIAQGGAWFWARSEPTRQRPGNEYHGMPHR